MKTHRRLTMLVAAAAVAAVLADAAPTSAAFPGTNGRIAYVTTVGDHRAIYTEGPEGVVNLD